MPQTVCSKRPGPADQCEPARPLRDDTYMAGPARRHHLVSKFYLRHFADENDMITTVFLPGDRSIVQNIANASVRNNFYTGIGHDGQETDAAEQAFSLIEAPAADAWEQIAAGVWPLPDTEREAVAGWVALHLLRGGGNRSQMSELGTDMFNLEILSGGRARLREVLREEGLPDDDDAVDREWIDLVADPLRVEAHPNHHPWLHRADVAAGNRDAARSLVGAHLVSAPSHCHQRPPRLRRAERAEHGARAGHRY
jgi:hypothetical protein